MASIAGGAAAATSAGTGATIGAGTTAAGTTAGTVAGTTAAEVGATTGALEGATAATSAAAPSTGSFWGAINETFKDLGNQMASQYSGGLWKGNVKDTFTKDNLVEGAKNYAEDYVNNEIKKESEEGKEYKPFTPQTTSDVNSKENIQKVAPEHGFKNEKPQNLLGQIIGGLGNKAADTINSITSDETSKEDIQEAGGIIPEFAEIDAFLYRYKPEAQAEYSGTGKVNDQQNFGVMAQDLQQNPLTQSTVIEDENGKLAVDGSRLATVNTAVISELCRKVMELESIVYGRQ